MFFQPQRLALFFLAVMLIRGTYTIVMASLRRLPPSTRQYFSSLEVSPPKRAPTASPRTPSFDAAGSTWTSARYSAQMADRTRLSSFGSGSSYVHHPFLNPSSSIKRWGLGHGMPALVSYTWSLWPFLCPCLCLRLCLWPWPSLALCLRLRV